MTINFLFVHSFPSSFAEEMVTIAGTGTFKYHYFYKSVWMGKIKIVLAAFIFNAKTFGYKFLCILSRNGPDVKFQKMIL